jgi:diamine N-acetyltransferase
MMSDVVEPVIQLSVARQKDMQIILPLVQEFYQHFGYPYDESQKRRVLKELLHNPSFGRMLLIAHDGNPIGYVLLTFSFSLEFNGSVAFIDELFLGPADRQKGIGSGVLAQVESLCTNMGMKAVRLESEVENRRATALYARFGYHAHKRHIMTKVLHET